MRVSVSPIVSRSIVGCDEVENRGVLNLWGDNGAGRSNSLEHSEQTHMESAAVRPDLRWIFGMNIKPHIILMRLFDRRQSILDVQVHFWYFLESF